MYDSKRLLQGLKQYQESLEKHYKQLKKDFKELEDRWQSFNNSAEGDYINQFRLGWLRTRSQFQNYISQSQKILDLLKERIEFLDTVNRADMQNEGARYATPTANAKSASESKSFAESLNYEDVYNHLDEIGGSVYIRASNSENPEIAYFIAERKSPNRIKIKDTNIGNEKHKRKGIGSMLLKNLEERLSSGTEIYFLENQQPGFWIAKGFKERKNPETNQTEFFKIIE